MNLILQNYKQGIEIDRKSYRVFHPSKQIILNVQLTHKFDLCLHTRGCREEERNFLDILSCTPAEGKSSLKIVCHDPHSRRGIDSWIREGSLRTQTISTSHNTGHEYHLITIFFVKIMKNKINFN